MPFSLCPCLGPTKAPSIRMTENNTGLKPMSPEQPMPDETEVNRLFTELVAELDLDQAHQKAMFSLPLDKKWQIYCTKKKEASEPNAQNSPDNYINRIKTLFPGEENPSQRNVELMDSLKTALRTQPMSFVTRFIEAAGLPALLNFLENMSYQMANSSAHTSVIGCIKALMNTSQGRSEVLKHPSAIKVIALSLRAEDVKTRVATYEILAGVCLVPGGHKQVLQSMAYYQTFFKERTRFQSVMIHLDQDTGEYKDDISIKAAVMSLINALLVYGPGKENLEFRLHLRYEFLMLGINQVIQKMKALDNAMLTRHIDFFELVRNSDDQDFASKFDTLHVDTKSATSQFEIIRRRLAFSPSYSHLLSIFQHFVILSSKSKTQYHWSMIDKVIQQIAIQLQDGSNPDFEIADMNLSKLAKQLAEDDEMKLINQRMRELQKERDETQRQLQKKEHECEVKGQEKEELMETVTKMKARLEKEAAQVADLQAQLTEAQTALTTERGELAKLQHCIKLGSLPDDTKLGVISTPPPAPAAPAPPPAGGPPPPPPPPPGGPGGPPPPPPPPGAGPGAPPPPPMGGMVATPARTKKVPKPANALKSFNWIKLPEAQVGGTVWKTLNDEELYNTLNLKDFEQAFSAYQHKDSIIAAPVEAKQERAKELSVIEGRRAQNCVILLSRLKMSIEEISKAILTVDKQEELPKDMCEQLLKFMPTAEECQLLGEHKQEMDQMARADRFLFEVSRIPHYEQRFQALYFKKKFSERLADVKSRIQYVLDASRQVFVSKKLRSLLEIVLAYGNFMNRGNRGNAFGFKLTSLNKMIDTKSSQNREVTFLNYLITVFEKQFPKVLELPNDLNSVLEAAKVSLPETEGELNKLKKGLADIEKEVAHQQERPSNLSKDCFVQVMSDFVTLASFKFSEVTDLSEDMDKRYKQTVKYYGEDPAKVAPDEFFGTLTQFLDNLKNAQVQNLQRLKQKQEEEKRARLEEKKRMEREQRLLSKKQGKSYSLSKDRGDEKGEFDDLISSLKTGDAFREDMINKQPRKKGGPMVGGPQGTGQGAEDLAAIISSARPSKSTQENKSYAPSNSSAPAYTSKYSQPVVRYR